MARGFKEKPTVTQNTVLKNNLEQRIKQIRNDAQQLTPTEKNISISLYDIDHSLGYYFENVIIPTVVENGEKIPVPVVYGTPERWASMATQGYYRDGKSKLVYPLIMYRRNSIAKNEQVVFPRIDQLYFMSKMKYNKNNRYDNFSLLNPEIKDLKKEDTYYYTYMPNYVIITYDCIVWTSFVEQLNNIVEQIIFHSYTYWGDATKFKFKTDIDSVETAVEMTAEQERIVKANFTISLYGYLLPENLATTPTTKVGLSPNKIKLSEKIL